MNRVFNRMMNNALFVDTLSVGELSKQIVMTFMFRRCNEFYCLMMMMPHEMIMIRDP